MNKKPTTIAAYIDAAPAAGQELLRQLYAILKDVAPDAEEAIKWGAPFFIEPRFLYSFSAHKAHLNFTPGTEVLRKFSKELEPHRTTEHFLQIPYGQPLPEKLIRKMAKYQLKRVSQREDDSFW
jgi:uncharacterized protein YdhG (YjbR/CyaY superfamily)